MNVTGLHDGGASPSAAAAPDAPAAAAVFDARLRQALEAPSAPAAPAGSLTLGQMLALYTRAAGGGTPRAPAVGDRILPVRGGGEHLAVGPVTRPLPGAVGSTYGPRVHPVHGDLRMHHGVDIAAPTGTPIRAFAGGTVTFAGPRGGYGNVVVVEHADGTEARYAHQSGIDVTVGQRLAAGDVVGRVGATGTATGPHLHFELRRDGESVDPGAYLP